MAVFSRSRTKARGTSQKDDCLRQHGDESTTATTRRRNRSNQTNSPTHGDDKTRRVAKPDLYTRLMKKKEERDARVERLRHEKKAADEKRLAEETRQRKRRFVTNKSGPDIYERLMEAQRKRDEKVENMREQMMDEYTYKPSIPHSRYSSPRTSRSGDESVFERLYRQSTASQSAYTSSDSASINRSSTASSSTTEMSTRLQRLYDNGLRRKRNKPKNDEEERQRREEHMLEQKEYTFKPKVYWGDIIGVDRRESVGRIGIYPRNSIPPEPKKAVKPQKKLPKLSPPREILITSPNQHRQRLEVLSPSPAPITGPTKQQHHQVMTTASPWKSPPRPARKVLHYPPSLTLEPEKKKASSQVLSDFPVLSPLRERSLSFLQRTTKQSYISKLLDVQALSDMESSSGEDGVTSEEENSEEEENSAGYYGSETDNKTEYGSI